MVLEKINHNDIQGIFRGFDKRWPVGRFFYLSFAGPRAGCDLLHRVGPVTSYRDLERSPPLVVNVALTYPGLVMLGLNPDVLRSFPADFRQGMVRRADLNGDVDASDPTRWDAFWRDGDKVLVWVGVYAHDAEILQQWTASFEEWVRSHHVPDQRAQRAGDRRLYDALAPHGGELRPRHGHIESATPQSGATIEIVGTQDVKRFWSDPAVKIHIDDESTNPRESVVLEHFGFRDGLSNPTIAGLDQKRLIGSGKLDRKGKWQPLAAGEFLLGYVDEMGEVPVAPVPPTLAKNGSFMVQRKLEQDVDGFRAYLERKAAQVSANGNGAVSADYLAAKMLGRRRDGRPFADTDTLNDFRYAKDEAGQKCPLGAHMRRANPRDSMDFESTLVDRHRILRRAITYGEPVPHGRSQKEINANGQGLMFITLQADITRQFEFVQQQWINFGNDFNQGNDRDPIAGNQAKNGRMTIPGDGEHPTVICDDLPQFVTTRGGDYFFLPGVGALDLLARGRFTEINTET